MSHCKIEHQLLILYIQKNFTTTSKNVYIYVFYLFFLELILVKIDRVSALGNCNRNSIGVRPTVSNLAAWLCKTEWNIAFMVTFLKNDGADYALGQVIEIY